MLSIEIAIEQNVLAIDEARLRQAAELILQEAGYSQGALSIAVVDDPTVHTLNRQYLQHDYPTDVLSFLLEQEGSRLEGEVIVSADTAIRVARQLAWPPEHELLLYVVHGTLHLVGYDDLQEQLRAEMQDAERRILARLGIERREGFSPDGSAIDG